jgi:hypothetical protein
MKTFKKFIFLALLILTTANISFAQAKLTITFYAVNFRGGFDNISRMQLFIDEEEVTTSPEKKQSEINSISVNVKPGFHRIRGVIWANYRDEGWMERTLENGYSFDWVLDIRKKLKKGKKTIKVIFDVYETEVIVK